jgi:competence protein ComEA
LAALELVNLGGPLADGQQVLVPLRGSARMPSIGDFETADGTVPGGKVHLNSATLEQLDELPGVGPITTEERLHPIQARGRSPTVAISRFDRSTSFGRAV